MPLRSRHAGLDPAFQPAGAGSLDSRFRGNDGRLHRIVICAGAHLFGKNRVNDLINRALGVVVIRQ